MLALAMKSEYQYDIDIMKVLYMLAIHELGETIIGDLTQFQISKEEKEKPLDQAPSGITGLETSLALGIRSLVEPGYISLMKLMELMSKNPAEFYRMVPGSIEPGAPADLVIFSEHELWRVEHFASKAENSPFIGWELPGKIHFTICNGMIVYRGDR